MMKCLLGVFIHLMILSFSAQIFAAEDKDKNAGTSPTYGISGDALLLTQFVDRGLAMSDRNPALNASFLFNLGSQFRFGFWGSNISNISSNDDNFWFKFFADIKILFNDKASARIYINDDRFYKVNIRNGQHAGIFLDYDLFNLQVEWQSNYEGTKTAAQYFNFGKTVPLKKDFKAGAKLGYVMQTAPGLDNYFDGKIFINYQLTANASFELAATSLTNSTQFGNTQFGSRGDSTAILSLALSY